jgi:cytohesin
MTPLHWAARNGDSLAVKLLIQWNANIDARDIQQCTPLHEACVSGDLKSITLLQDAGADVNAENDECQTPLFMFPNEPDGLVSLLVQRGSNIKHRDIYGWTVLHDAAHQGRSQVIHEYITHGADINAIDNWERTPVQRGIINNRFSAVSALLRSSKIHGVSLTCQNIGALPLYRTFTGLWP